MRHKLIVYIGGIAIVAGVAINLSLGSNKGALSDLTLVNIEALARNESMPSDCGGCWVDHRCKVGNITWTFAYPTSEPKPCDC